MWGTDSTVPAKISRSFAMYSRPEIVIHLRFCISVCLVAVVMANSNKDIDSGGTGGGSDNFKTDQWRQKIRNCLIAEKNNATFCYNQLEKEEPSSVPNCEGCGENRQVKNSPKTALVSILNSWEDTLKSRLKQELGKIFTDIARNITSGKLQTFGGNQTGVSGRKMKKENMAQLLVTPGLIMAGILPWVLPQLKTLVMIVGLMNQVAFSMSFFALLRRLIFERNNEEHIFYVNQGYTNEKRDPQYGHYS